MRLQAAITAMLDSCIMGDSVSPKESRRGLAADAWTIKILGIMAMGCFYVFVYPALWNFYTWSHDTVKFWSWDDFAITYF